MADESRTTADRFTAEAFEQEREPLWNWVRALGDKSREQFDREFDAELVAMKAEEAA